MSEHIVPTISNLHAFMIFFGCTVVLPALALILFFLKVLIDWLRGKLDE